MPAANYDILIEQGATWSRTFTWTDANNNPINITAYTAAMQIRPTAADPTILATITTANSKITIDGPNGKITVTIPATETAAYSFQVAVYDLDLTAADGITVTRLLQGGVELSLGVTR